MLRGPESEGNGTQSNTQHTHTNTTLWAGGAAAVDAVAAAAVRHCTVGHSTVLGHTDTHTYSHKQTDGRVICGVVER